jgi:GT2 family glycosyltransferase
MTSLHQPLPATGVVIATIGRPEILTATVKFLLNTQSLKPAMVIVSCVAPEDAGDVASLPTVKVVTGPAGSSAQRNAGLLALPPEVEVVVFLDDDFVCGKDWLAVAARTFRDQPDIVSLTGQVLVDDIKGPGLSFDQAVRIIQEAGPSAPAALIEPFSPYGCNMAFRRSVIGESRFDERLVFYGWLEDRDFGGTLAKKGGRLVKCTSACGVHMGVKRSRVSGDRLGYSQVVNPCYLLKKGTMTFGEVIGQIFRNVVSNIVFSVSPEPYIDRRGRLRGNLLGFADVLRGRLEPERAAAINRRTSP